MLGMHLDGLGFIKPSRDLRGKLNECTEALWGDSVSQVSGQASMHCVMFLSLCQFSNLVNLGAFEPEVLVRSCEEAALTREVC